MEHDNIIYHIVTRDDFIQQSHESSYTPIGFEQDGFIHCTGEKSTSLLVLEDYFAHEKSPILILQIAQDKLSSDVRFEEPSPQPGAGTTHLREGLVFPHIYGRLNLDAILAAGYIEKHEGHFLWPTVFVPLLDVL